MKARIMMYTDLYDATIIKKMIAQKEQLCKSGWTLERKWTSTYKGAQRTLKIRFTKNLKGQRGRIIEFKTSDLSVAGLNKLATAVSKLGNEYKYLDSYLSSDIKKGGHNYKLYVLLFLK